MNNEELSIVNYQLIKKVINHEQINPIPPASRQGCIAR